jgi:negative regulator of flagellin synthesis FlgM
MKVNGTDPQSTLTVYKTTQVERKPLEADLSKSESAASIHQDRLALSERGRSIADAQRTLAAVPDVRESLVEKIRNDLQDGTYTIDSQKTAEGLLRESLVNQAAMT